jgi:predicted RNase H-like HicB family nuclease
MKKPEKNQPTTLFTSVIWKEGKYFVAQCLNVDVSSFGKTYEEAVKNIKEAVELYMEDAPKNSVNKIEMPSISVAEIKHQYA